MVIIIIHELGHIITSVFFHYSVNKITLYPFGGVTNIEKPINTPLVKELIIAISGIVFQLLLWLILIFLYEKQIITTLTWMTFNRYNFLIIIFNFLPIISLDGYIIFRTLLEFFFPVRLSNFITFNIALITIIIFTLSNIIFEWHNYLIISYLLWQTIKGLKERYIYEEKFYIERYLNSYSFTKNKIITKANKMYKDHYHYLYKESKLFSEKEFLAKRFDKNRVIC